MSVTVAPAAEARAGTREWAGLAVLALPMLLLSLDNSVLFLALPHLTADLRPGPAEMLWIMDVYGFMMAGFLITMGNIGDRIGRRRLLLIGAAAFGAASVLAAYASSPAQLIAARVLLGVSGSVMAPSSLALISAMFRDARQRALAIGVFTACFMGGAALGPVVGGVMLESFWWGSVFLLGAPVMVLLLATAPVLLPENRGGAGGRIDVPSVLLSLAAILPVVHGLKEIAADPAHPLPYLAIGAGVAAGTVFVRRQRVLADPFLDLSLFRNRSFGAAMALLPLVMIIQSGVYLFASQYLQTVRGLPPLRAGLWLAVPALALAAGSIAAPVLARRVRPGTIVTAGLTVAAIGFLVMARADDPGTLVTGLSVGFVGTAPIGALGLGLIVGAAPPERAGAASAVAESSGELGVALGIALLGSLGTAVYRHALTAPEGAPPAAADSLDGAVSAAEGLPPDLAARLLDESREAFMTSLTVAGGACALLALGLAALTLALLRHLRPIGQD
ncbi:MFS transporter [Spirillospora sp. NPDC029432]|uniref:MFS transporter n=1 Tax=Spirillospora sp. NPDC029432 TaxID=3154599 RepID=UPI003455C0AC